MSEAPSAASLLEVNKIWSEAPHNAFTDLLHFRGTWYCVFREGKDHTSFDGSVRVLTSLDRRTWASVARVAMPGADLRDPKLTLTPDDRLMLIAGNRVSAQTGRTLAWFSFDGTTWGAPQPIGGQDEWLWRVTWHQGVAYTVAYSWRPPTSLRLYTSRAGRTFQPLEVALPAEDSPNETSLAFCENSTMYALVRREAGSGTALFGEAPPPYAEWTWQDTGVALGGPDLLRLPDGRLIAAGRVEGPHTALLWADPNSGQLTEFLSLPSGGDCGYPGLVYNEGLLWVSYYSSHEGQASIYLAKVQLP